MLLDRRIKNITKAPQVLPRCEAKEPAGGRGREARSPSAWSFPDRTRLCHMMSQPVEAQCSRRNRVGFHRPIDSGILIKITRANLDLRSISSDKANIVYGSERGFSIRITGGLMSRGLKKRRLTRSSAPPASHLFEKCRYSIDITLLIVPNSSPSPKMTTAYPPTIHHTTTPLSPAQALSLLTSYLTAATADPSLHPHAHLTEQGPVAPSNAGLVQSRATRRELRRRFNGAEKWRR